ncbi:hypothetical protein BDZ89DRAFT_41621 [Hymenopellis radicata]|nr:hypothetical protein BDZ89DRAFT_41621 [Hymenopellis radicata]
MRCGPGTISIIRATSTADVFPTPTSSPMPCEPPSDAPRSNDSNNPNILHCTCCPCRSHGAPSSQGDDAGAFHSDTSTVNDTASEYGRSARPILEYHGRTRHSHMKLFRNWSPKYPVPTDSFDYEQKYPPDDEYKEMSETARVFETYMDECTKFDFDMVENWRDGLDMLLVFAALFSAVVTTLVVQSSQSLHVDYAEVTTILMLRLIDIQVAISNGEPAPLVQNSNPSASFRATSGDLWVNGLWFTSLVLSLTTTLIAVLTKQWINEYMILPSGTPRDRARIRHFRFIGLQQWHVPLIIGLLPVLMHVSLGVFFAGFLIFVCSLSGTMAIALSCVTAIGALAYLISNILPLFYANCPYKTPLALYSFMFISCIRRRLESWRSRHTVKSNISRSLKDVERSAISRQTDELDALAVSWLHNASSNASVQSIRSSL